MTDAQKQAAIKAATETIQKLMETAPDYGEVGTILTLHRGDVRHVSEQLKRVTLWGHNDE
jgi:hypothetical protein